MDGLGVDTRYKCRLCGRLQFARHPGMQGCKLDACTTSDGRLMKFKLRPLTRVVGRVARPAHQCAIQHLRDGSIQAICSCAQRDACASKHVPSLCSTAVETASWAPVGNRTSLPASGHTHAPVGWGWGCQSSASHMPPACWGMMQQHDAPAAASKSGTVGHHRRLLVASSGGSSTTALTKLPSAHSTPCQSMDELSSWPTI